MTDLAGGQIGSEAQYKVEFAGGKLVVSVNYQGIEAGAAVSVSVDAVSVLEALKKLIPGQVDDAIFSIIEAAIKA